MELFFLGFYFRIREHAYTCSWMSGSHVMVPTNILRGSVHVHEMRKRKLILIKEVFSLKKFGGSFN
jgi:hypothetical protein